MQMELSNQNDILRTSKPEEQQQNSFNDIHEKKKKASPISFETPIHHQSESFPRENLKRRAPHDETFEDEGIIIVLDGESENSGEN